MTQKTFLHIVDDEKFIDATWRICEAVSPGQHRYVMFGDGAPMRHVKFAPVERLPLGDAQNGTALRGLTAEHRVVVLHNLDKIKLDVLARLPRGLTVWWLGWGFDYYDLARAELLMPRTRQLLPPRPVQLPLLRRAKDLLKRVRGPSARIAALHRVDFFGPVIVEDYRIVKGALPDLPAQYLQWHYGTLEDDMIRGFEGRGVSGSNILVGNSATMTNNHLEAFEMIRAVGCLPGEVLVPLSYGNADYQQSVQAAGREMLGDAFRPLVDFMAIDDYIAVLSTCSSVIMNHLRQQALGNIVIMLYLGAKVFLDRRNPLFENLRIQGMHVFATDQFAAEVGRPLDEARRTANRDLLRSTWSREAVYANARRSFDTLEKHARSRG